MSRYSSRLLAFLVHTVVAVKCRSAYDTIVTELEARKIALSGVVNNVGQAFGLHDPMITFLLVLVLVLHP